MDFRAEDTARSSSSETIKRDSLLGDWNVSLDIEAHEGVGVASGSFDDGTLLVKKLEIVGCFLAEKTTCDDLGVGPMIKIHWKA